MYGVSTSSHGSWISRGSMLCNRLAVRSSACRKRIGTTANARESSIVDLAHTVSVAGSSTSSSVARCAFVRSSSSASGEVKSSPWQCAAVNCIMRSNSGCSPEVRQKQSLHLKPVRACWRYGSSFAGVTHHIRDNHPYDPLWKYVKLSVINTAVVLHARSALAMTWDLSY